MYIFYEDNNGILVIFDVAKSVKKNDNSIEIAIFTSFFKLRNGINYD